MNKRSSVLSFAIAAVAALSLAGAAHADDCDDYDDCYYGPANEIYASPDTYADPATDWVPWASGQGSYAEAPQVDTSVHQSP